MVEKWLRKYLLDIILYVLIAWLIWIILSREITDLTCTDESATVCDAGSPMALAPGQPEEGDTLEQLLDKISFTTRYEHNTVVWRRAFISSAIIVFIVLYVILRRFPRALEFLSGMIIAFTVLYATILIYQPLTTDKAVNQVDELIIEVKKRI